MPFLPSSAEAPAPLVSDEVHLWTFCVDSFFENVSEEERLASLPETDSDYVQRAKVDSVRRERLVGRVVARAGLAHYGRRRANQWCFFENELGKPLAFDAEGLEFNLSHSAGLVVCAFARGRRVGVDTESVERTLPEESHFHRFFADLERRQIASVPAEQRPETLFRYWTLKEAYAKARGIGLSIGFEEFRVELADPPVLHDERTESRWHLREVRSQPHHLIAVAAEIRGDQEELRDHGKLRDHKELRDREELVVRVYENIPITL